MAEMAEQPSDDRLQAVLDAFNDGTLHQVHALLNSLHPAEIAHLGPDQFGNSLTRT